MEPYSREALGADRPHFLNTPQRVDVQCDGQGLPVRVRVRQRWRSVQRIVDVWRVDDEWWARDEVQRLYVSVLTDDGRRLTLFRDMREATWWQQRY